jgi:hypothetical protein
MPSYFDQSVAVQWCDRDEIEDSKRYIEKAKINPEANHNINIVGEDIVWCSSHDIYIDKHDDNSDNCEEEIRRRSCK